MKIYLKYRARKLRFLYYFPLRRVSSSSGYSTVSVYFAIVTYNSIIYYVTLYVCVRKGFT